jgi:prepilin-type N-terminal cleavage/methylation domain-containing protein
MNVNGGAPSRSASGDGFSLIELLIVVVVLGVLATIVVFAVRGLSEDAKVSTCEADRHVLSTAVEAYFAQAPNVVIPPSGPLDADQYERTLVSAGLVREVSVMFDVSAAGELATASNSPC